MWWRGINEKIKRRNNVLRVEIKKQLTNCIHISKAKKDFVGAKSLLPMDIAAIYQRQETFLVRRLLKISFLLLLTLL
jgi:hypothetical protein